jgi:hypothetical protein
MLKLTPWCAVLAFLSIVGSAARAADAGAEQRKAIDKGLEFLAKLQAADGHWEARGGKKQTAMTALAGMALFMDGNTPQQGRYKDNVRKAVEWLLEQSQKDGMIGDAKVDKGDYMDGHGHAMLFLASVCAREEKGALRKKLEGVLKAAVEFTGKAQTKNGGWSFVSASEVNDFDAGSSAAAQIQGLQACLLAGIDETKPLLAKALKYLADCTTPRGGVIFSLAQAGTAKNGSERPALTAAALACGLCTGLQDPDLVKKWLSYCQFSIPAGGAGRMGEDEATQFYFAQAIHALGETGHVRLFPKSSPSEGLTWSKYKKVSSPLAGQGADGNWNGGVQGPVLATATSLIILQLETTSLPIFQRPIPKKDEVPTLVRLLGERAPAVRRDAAEDLGSLGTIRADDTKESVGKLRDLATKDDDTQVRSAAAAALGKIRLEPDKAVPLLIQLLKNDADGKVHLAAIVALGNFGAEAKDAVAALHEAADRASKEAKSSPDDRARMLAEEKLAAIEAALKRVGK